MTRISAISTTETSHDNIDFIPGIRSDSTDTKIPGSLLQRAIVGARVTKSANQTANFTSGAEISWATEVYDDATLWTAGSPNRFTIPPSLNGRRADVVVTVRIDASTVSTWKVVSVQHRNSSGTILNASAQTTEVGLSSGVYSQAALHGVAVSAGDYFIALFQEESDTSSTIVANAFTGFAIKVY